MQHSSQIFCFFLMWFHSTWFLCINHNFDCMAQATYCICWHFAIIYCQKLTGSFKNGSPLPVRIGLKMTRKPGEGAVTLNTNLIRITFPWKIEHWKTKLNSKRIRQIDQNVWVEIMWLYFPFTFNFNGKFDWTMSILIQMSWYLSLKSRFRKLL